MKYIVIRLLCIQDGGGSFSLPTSTSSAVDPEPQTVSTVAEGGVDEVDTPLENIEEEPSGLSSSGEEEEKDEEGEELAVFTEPVDDGGEASEEVGSGRVGEAESPAQQDNVAGGIYVKTHTQRNSHICRYMLYSTIYRPDIDESTHMYAEGSYIRIIRKNVVMESHTYVDICHIAPYTDQT